MGRLTLLVALVALAVPAPAAADDTPSKEEEEDRRARELFLRGEDHYAAGRYEQAASLYEEAYDLSRRPELLFNIANCFERMGKYGQAADYLRRYLASPRASDVVSVRERIKRLELAEDVRQREIERGLEEEERQRRDTTALLPVEAFEEGDKGARPGARRRSTARTVSYVLLAGGGAGLAGATGFAVAQRGAGRDAAALCAPGGLCPTTAEGALAREKRLARLADASAAIGLIAAGAGAYLLVRDLRARDPGDRDREVRMVPLAVPAGAGIGLAGGF